MSPGPGVGEVDPLDPEVPVTMPPELELSSDPTPEALVPVDVAADPGAMVDWSSSCDPDPNGGFTVGCDPGVPEPAPPLPSAP